MFASPLPGSTYAFDQPATSTAPVVPVQRTADDASRRPSTPYPSAGGRVSVDGRHLLRDGRTFRARGVTYGSFAPRHDGSEFPEPARLRRDLEAIAGLGLNAVRTYTLPSEDLLDAAAELGLVVHAGLHYPDWRTQSGTGRAATRAVLDAGLRAVEQALERLAGRPEVLAVSVGNEVPADLVRLHGVGRVERTLGRLVDELHRGDPDCLVSYGTYPSTEYLRVPGIDLATVNIFLDDREDLRRYLRHLAVEVGDVPLIVGEIGIPLTAGTTGRRDPDQQADKLAAQLDVLDETGVAGGFVFSWTDDWVVGGESVEGWGFGLTDADRRPRPSAAVAGAWARRPLRALRSHWPTLSVIVCAYNEAHNLDACLTSLTRVDYPGLEVLVVDDGSSDATVDVAKRYPFRVLELPHAGLSVARNAGARAAGGEIVAFLDADAACHPEWPFHLALAFAEDGVEAAGGPNLPRGDAELVERAVAASPGNPIEVLSSPDRAEHVPGCNCAIRRDVLLGERLLDEGGFLPEFTAAGDDVDLFWRVLDAGGAVAFNPAAQVTHARRSTVRGYLRQQRGYGRAERMVSGRHPHRFNRSGQAVWSGSLYGGPAVLPSRRRDRIEFGVAGTAAYQSRRSHGYGLLGRLPTRLPALLALAVVGLMTSPVLPAGGVVAGIALAAVGGYVVAAALGCRPPRSEKAPGRFRLLVGVLHLLQPLARARGRRGTRPLEPLARRPVPPGDRRGWVDALHVVLARRATVRRGRTTDRHDLAVSVGWLLVARVTTALRWGARPVLRVAVRPRPPALALVAGTATAGVLAPGPALLLALAVAGIAVVEGSLLSRRIRAAGEVTAPRAVK